MELQCLQEALKVEIQCHQKLVAQMKQDPQDGELKKQLHERHDRITALSEKQKKLSVRSCPVGGTTKPLSLIKPPPPPSSQSISISVLPANPVAKTAPVAMVTAHMTGGQKVVSGSAAPGSSSSPPSLQTSSINLRTNRGSGGAVLQPHSRREMLGNLTVVPIKVPQVSSLHRLSGQTSTVLPQVQPKSVIPASLLPSHSPVSLPREQPASLLLSHSPVSLPREQPASLLPSHSPVSLPREQPASLLLSHSPVSLPREQPVSLLLSHSPVSLPREQPVSLLPSHSPVSLPREQPASLLPSHGPVSLPQEQPASQKQSSCQALSLLNLQRATAVVSPKSHTHSFNHTHSSSHTLTQSHTLGPALPTANSTFSPERLSIGQGDTATSTTSSPPPLAQILVSPLAQTLVSPPAQTLVSPLAQTLVSPLAQTQSLSPAQTQSLSLAQTQSLSPALAWPGGISPTSTSSSSPTATSASVAPGVTFSIISASPPADTGNNRVWTISEAVKVQPLVFNTDNKLKIIQPEAETPSSSQNSPGGPQGGTQEIPSITSTTNPSTSPSATAAKKEEDEDPEKMSFMVALGLVTTETLEEIQTKRQERKRRSTANPAYSGLVQPERKRLASNYLNNPLFLSVRATGDYRWKEELEHDDHCSVCKGDGELQLCHNCPRAYHPDCLHPPLKTPPRGVWVCTKCQKKVLNKENMSWPQNFVQSYVTHKTVREGEKRSLLRRNVELKKECAHLEEQDQQLSKSLTQKVMDVRERLIGQQRDTQSSLERLKALIRLIQRDQMIQVTMTATATTTGVSLLSLPWIKPAATHTVPPAGPSMLLQQKALVMPQSQTQSQAQGNV